MSNVLRRLRKLEALSTDVSGLLPRSKAWLSYWEGETDGLLAGESRGDMGRIPLEVIDSILGHDETSQQTNSAA